jgi:predicted DNA-binding protein with PD1-like motif
MKALGLRLQPDQDLKQSLKAFVISQNIQAGYILSAIGSLKVAKLRFADRLESDVLTGKFEILSLNGTLSVHGLHLHLAIADQNGKTIGGHLDTGCLIYTTAEIIIGEIPNLMFLRTPDSQTGFLELEIKKREIREQSSLDAP